MDVTAYYIPVSTDPAEREPVLIDLNPDGSANLSYLPENVRQHLEDFGFPNPLHTLDVMPQDGANFITALLESNNPYLQFRRADKNGA